MGERTGVYSILVERPEEEDHLKDTSVDGMVMLKWIFKKWDGGMDGIDLAHGRDRWCVLLNSVMNPRVP